MPKNTDLFGYPVDDKTSEIVIQKTAVKLSKEEITFNTLIKQIKTQREQFAAWENLHGIFQKKYSLELDPLLREMLEVKTKIVHRLDQINAEKGFSKIERSQIVALILDLTSALLDECDDAELKTVFDKYSHISHDEITAEKLTHLKTMLEMETGIELADDLDLNSPESVFQHIKEQLDTQAEEEQRSPQRKKTAKQLAKEQKQQAEEQHLSQSLREIYRKLASALHPDRESDAQERERKNALMQRVNQAHESGNLLQLLELQLEIEQIDANTINNLAPERLQRYNKILKEQLKDLRDQISQIEHGFRTQFDINPAIKLTPANALKRLNAEVISMEQGLVELRHDLKHLQDIKAAKVWLKQMQQWYDEQAFYDFD